MDEIINSCKDLQPWLIKIRRELHKNAELAFKEFKTKDIIKKYLKEINVNFYEIENTTAIVALLDVNSSITIGIRADMDGLPIHEESNIDYKSEDYNTMHACGHDAHMAIAIGVCKIFKKYKNILKVNVKFIFQSGEESGGGNKGNIICDEVNLAGTLRTLNHKDRLLAKKRINDICIYIGKTFNGEIIVDIKEGIPPLINNDNLVNKVIKNGIEILGKGNVIIKRTSSMGAEDFAYFLEKIPDVFFNIGCSNNKINSPIHIPTFNIDENCLVIGVMMQVKNILMFQ